MKYEMILTSYELSVFHKNLIYHHKLKKSSLLCIHLDVTSVKLNIQPQIKARPELEMFFSRFLIFQLHLEQNRHDCSWLLSTSCI